MEAVSLWLSISQVWHGSGQSVAQHQSGVAWKRSVCGSASVRCGMEAVSLWLSISEVWHGSGQSVAQHQ